MIALIQKVQRMIAPLKRAIALLVSRAVYDSSDDSTPIQFSKQQIFADEVSDKVEVFHYFGFSSRAPKNTEAILVSVGANREHMACIASVHRDSRFKNLEEGETVIFTEDGTFLHLKKDGQVHLKTSQKVKVEAPDAEFTGNVKIFGTLTVEQTSQLKQAVTMDATLAVQGASTLTGPVTAPGGVSSVGVITAATIADPTGSMGALRSAYNAHKHPAGTPNTGTTDSPA